MQVGHDQQTSANCKARLWFGLDKQLSTLVLKIQLYIFNQQRLWADGILIPNLHKALPVSRHTKMKHSLSHKQIGIIQLTGLCIGGILPWVIFLIFINSLPLIGAIIGTVVINGLTFYFSLRVYAVEFDTDFLFLKRHLKTKKIDLKDVVNVRTLPFPIYVYFGHAYIAILTYIEDGIKKKSFTITRGSFSWTPTLDNINEISLLQQYILNKKYGR